MSNPDIFEIMSMKVCWHLHTVHMTHSFVEWHHLSNVRINFHDLKCHKTQMMFLCSRLCTNKIS